MAPPLDAAVALGVELRRLRRGRGLSQRQLADLLHVASHSTVVDFEAGRRVPAPDIMAAYERVLGLPSGALAAPRDQALAERAASEATALLANAGRQRPSLTRAPVPRQLPAVVSHFTGRAEALAELDRLLGGADPVPVVISAISGMGGVGKTALAVHWAHQARSRFVDGDLYVDLCGFHPHREPLPPDAVLGQFLTALGVPGDAVPIAPDERLALYRTLVSDRRMLVLLDNARSAEQVRPLLPGGPSVVLVTSRNRMAGLVAREGVHRLALGVLTAREAGQLLRRSLGAARVDAEPGATAALAEQCGYHPLALRVAAERVAAGPDDRIADAVAELADRVGRLSALSAPDDEASALRAVFTWSYEALPTAARRLFRMLGLHDGPEIGVASGTLVGAGEAESRRLLAVLAGAHLLEEVAADRYRLHDLMRLYARERAVAEEGDADRGAAVRRLAAWHLHSAAAARVAMDPQLPPLRLAPAAHSIPPGTFDGHASALAWFEVEEANLVAFSGSAAEYGLDDIGWQLPTAMFGYFNLRKRYGDWVTTHLSAAGCAHRLGDAEAEGKVLCNLGSAYRPQRRLDEAQDCYERALLLFATAGWRLGEAKALGNLASTYQERGEFARSVEVSERATAVFAELGDVYGQALCLTNLGRVHSRAGRNDLALDAHERALALFEQVDDRPGQARVLGNLGVVRVRLGEPALALDLLTRAMDIFGALGDEHEQATNRVDLADALYALGRGEEAAQRLRESLAVFRRLGDPHKVAGVLARLDQLAGHPAPAG